MKRPEIVSVRFSGDEITRLRAAAARTGRTVSEVLRAVAAGVTGGTRPELTATTGSHAPQGLWSIVWDNGVVGPNYQPAATF